MGKPVIRTLGSFFRNVSASAGMASDTFTMALSFGRRAEDNTDSDEGVLYVENFGPPIFLISLRLGLLPIAGNSCSCRRRRETASHMRGMEDGRRFDSITGVIVNILNAVCTIAIVI